jgi:anti-sigma B factor antagonist
MDIKQRVRDDVTILDLSGRLILGDGEESFKEMVDDLINQDRTKILLNLTDVNYIDSAGIGVVIWKYIPVTKRGGTLKLLNPQPRTHTVLSITRLLTVLETFQTEDEAIESFSRPAANPTL